MRGSALRSGRNLPSLFNLDTLRQNRELFILLIFIMITSIGMEVSFPYLIIYLENYVGVTKTEFASSAGRFCWELPCLPSPLASWQTAGTSA